MNQIKIILLTLALIPLLILPAQAREKGLISVRSEVDTTVITIGDRITYSIIIDRAEGLKIARPGEGLNLGGFEIKSYDFPEPERTDGRIIERFNFNISVYDTGHYAIPAYPVAYFPEDTSSKFQIIEAPAINIYVKSVLTDADGAELKDIKAPLEVPFDYGYWAMAGGGVLLALVLIWLIYYGIKKRRERGYVFTPPKPLPPAHVVALQAFETLFASDLLAREQYKAFFIRYADILRVYLEQRYYFPALEETTREIIYQLKGKLEQADLCAAIQKVLELADLVKFAKFIPEPQEVEQAKQVALDFIHQTKIVFEPESDETAPDSGIENEPVAQLSDGQENKI